MKNKLDHIDRKILEILQADADITNAKLSEIIGLSQAPTMERVRKLERLGILKSYHAVVDPTTVGLGVSTFILVSLSGHNKEDIEQFAEEVNTIPEIIECHHVTGQADFLLKVVCSDIPSYQELILGKISSIKGVNNKESLIILSTFKDSKVVPIP